MSYFKQEFTHPKLGTTSIIVLDQDEFDKNVDLLQGVFCETGKTIDDDLRDKLKKDGAIPVIGRGDTTQFLFEKYMVNTGTMGLIVRGYTRRLIRQKVELN